METELATNIAWIVGLGFLGVIGYKAYNKYANLEFNKNTEELKNKLNAEKAEIVQYVEKLKKSNENYRYQMKNLRQNYDLDLDDVELENEGSEELILSDIVKGIYPKLPPSLANLIDKEEFQNAIVKTVEKKPDILNTFIDKFLNKPADQEDTGSPLKLKETYL